MSPAKGGRCRVHRHHHIAQNLHPGKVNVFGLQLKVQCHVVTELPLRAAHVCQLELVTVAFKTSSVLSFHAGQRCDLQRQWCEGTPQGELQCWYLTAFICVIGVIFFLFTEPDSEKWKVVSLVSCWKHSMSSFCLFAFCRPLRTGGYTPP